MNSREREQQLYTSIIVKFLLNLPQNQKKDVARLCYHCQKAYYYYVDNVMKLNSERTQNWQTNRFTFFKQLQFYINKLNIQSQRRKSVNKQYCQSPQSILIFPNLNPQVLVAKLSEIKPVCGAIILNQSQTKVLVTKAMGKFGFPKGKWNQNQQPQQCAARQVQQETSLFIHTRIDIREKIQFISRKSAQTVFFIVRGVKESEKIKAQQNQIDEVFWMKITDVSKYLNSFAQRSRQAWKMYLDLQKDESKNVETLFKDFINFYCEPQVQTHQKYWNFESIGNPLLNFKFDTQKLMSVFH